MSYSPNGVIIKDGKLVTLIEVKCPYEERANSISSIIKNLKFINVNDINNTLNFSKKHSYYGQVQIGMAILNVPFTHFVIFASFDKSFVIMNILFEEYAINMLTTIKKSYFNYMLHFLCTTDEYDNDENIS